MLEITFEAPSLPLSINKANGLHWAARRRYLAPWRERVREAYEATSQDLKGVPCVVTVVLPFHDKRRRDPHNYVGTVVKALVDELVQAGQWPDDNPLYVVVNEPEITIGTLCTVRLEPARAA